MVVSSSSIDVVLIFLHWSEGRKSALMVTISLINWADIEMIINYMQRLKISILSIRIINKSALFYLRSTSKEK